MIKTNVNELEKALFDLSSDLELQITTVQNAANRDSNKLGLYGIAASISLKDKVLAVLNASSKGIEIDELTKKLIKNSSDSISKDLISFNDNEKIIVEVKQLFNYCLSILVSFNK